MSMNFLSKMVIDTAKEKGFNGVMELTVAVQKKHGLNYARVTKVWNGLLTAKIGDYITIMTFLESDIVIPLKKKTWK